VSLGGALLVHLPSGYTPAGDDKFVIINNQSAMAWYCCTTVARRMTLAMIGWS
jgi:hypothetical protein